MLAVDLPFVPAEFLKYLLGRPASCSHGDSPSLNGFFQPLCAVYRKQFLAAAEPRLAENRNKIDQFFARFRSALFLKQTSWNMVLMGPFFET